KEVGDDPMSEHSRGLAVCPTDGRVGYGAAEDAVVTAPGQGQGERLLGGHTGLVMALAFSPDGTRVATASQDGTVKLWDLADGHEGRPLRGHTGGVTCLAFNRDGTALVSASEDGTVKAWDVTPRPDFFPFRPGVWVTQVLFSPDGRQAALARFGATHFIDTG